MHQSAVILFVICLICFVTDGPIDLVFINKLPNFKIILFISLTLIYMRLLNVIQEVV